MDTQKMQALYGLKYNPFSQDVPVDALHQTTKIQSFCHRVESLVIDGGFALITGEPGIGKSVALRLLADRLAALRDLQVGTISRPQSGMSDFYREIGSVFGMSWTVSNRFGSFRTLREKWLAHIDTTLFRPVLLIDEAQEAPSAVLSELRLMASVCFDSKVILTVVLAGDNRLIERLRAPDLAPLGSRIRTRYRAEPAGRDEMIATMNTRIDAAGNGALVTPETIELLVDHAAGNYRTLMNSAAELLATALDMDAKRIDEKLFFDLYQPAESRPRKPVAVRRAQH